MSTCKNPQKLIDDAIALLQQVESVETANTELIVWKERFDDLVETIRYTVEDAQALYDDMKANHLSAGSIEAEGYLRCAKGMLRYVEQLTGDSNV